MFRISKDFEFSAAHHLEGLPPEHQCARVHGHNYTVRLILEADNLNGVGFVRDYGELDQFRDWLKNAFDHRDINDAEFVGNPTAENMARAIYEVTATLFPELAGVGVSETHKTWAYFYPGVVSMTEPPDEGLELEGRK
jgi:6-pyruvoyltetrahydropterin/6-carboxytetrahydropterin synthase